MLIRIKIGSGEKNSLIHYLQSGGYDYEEIGYDGPNPQAVIEVIPEPEPSPQPEPQPSA